MQDITTPQDHETVRQASEELSRPNDKTQVQAAPPPPETDPVPDKKTLAADKEYIDAVTDTAIAVLDNAQTTCFSIAANIKKRKRALKILPEKGVTRLIDLKAEHLANKGKGFEQELTGPDAQLIALDKVCSDYITDLPFTQKQMDMMRPGLKMIIERNAGKIPPEWLLITSMATAIGGNLAELYSW